MSILNKPYEISLWEDVWDSGAQQYKESRIMVIGADSLLTQARAQEPKLTRKTNGEVSFTFKMYYDYVDTTTGNKTHNIFVDYITNESKIKLYYDGQWFDFLVKNKVEDSKNCSYTYTLVDQHVNELSKNGFELSLESAAMNNVGTAEQLGKKILKNTGWGFESEQLVQTAEESLVMLKLPKDLSKYDIYLIVG